MQISSKWPFWQIFKNKTTSAVFCNGQHRTKFCKVETDASIVYTLY